MITNSWSHLVRDLTQTLVRWPSVTQTPDEASFAHHLHAVLATHPYFQAHPEHVWVEPIADDPYNRSNVYALVRRTGSHTVILSGHYDVVSVENYGQLAAWAHDPEALLPRLMADLELNATSPADLRALHDLQSGDYLPGRGALDMKSGLAAGIAVLYRWAEAIDNQPGTILLVATPDEEATSCGMRAAVQRLPALAQSWELEPIAAINLDSEADPGDGSEGRAVFLGSVGKLLPAVYIVGRDTHAGMPFDGVNPTLMAAEITRRIECNTALTDSGAGETAPPPTCLQQIDLKQGYDVTTPRTAWCLYNVLTHGRTAAQVLDIMQRVVQEALDATLDYVRTQAEHFGQQTGRAVPLPDQQPLVLTFAELKQRVLQRSDTAATQTISAETQRLNQDHTLTLPQLSLRITEMLWSRSGLTGPAAIIGLASLYYPAVHLRDTTPRHARLRQCAAEQAAMLSRETGRSIRLRPFFPGISDMSFLGCTEDAPNLAAMAANTPAWGSRIRFDYQAIQTLNLPAINIGPWGRDYHQRTERVNMPYSFEVVPELIWRIVNDLCK